MQNQLIFLCQSRPCCLLIVITLSKKRLKTANNERLFLVLVICLMTHFDFSNGHLLQADGGRCKILNRDFLNFSKQIKSEHLIGLLYFLHLILRRGQDLKTPAEAAESASSPTHLSEWTVPIPFLPSFFLDLKH